MKLRRSAELPLLLLALLLAASGDLSAQDRSPANDSSDFSESGRVAEPVSEPSEAPPEVSSEAPSEPSSPEPSSEAAPDSSEGSLPEPSTEAPSSPEPERRYAVPVSETPEPHRQPPSHGRHVPSTPGEPPAPSPDDEAYDRLDRDADSYPSESRVPNVVGAIDLDLSPGRTQVYVNGEYLGIVDQFDGWPSRLWLEAGTYELVFYLEGYRTLARRVTIYPGTMIGMHDRMEPGTSIPPEEFAW